jgi:hypothetical protein
LLEGQRDDLVGVVFVLLGFVCAWLWWSVNITLWRRWAERRGIDADELQWRGEQAQILSPEGSFIEQTVLDHIIERLRHRDGCACSKLREAEKG